MTPAQGQGTGSQRPQGPAGRGRPTKLTTELQSQVCLLIRAGNYIETAAAYVGITKPTLYDWMRRGRKERSGKYRDFSNAIEKALASSEIADVMKLDKAGLKNWQAIAWRLERRFPKRWGRKKDTVPTTG